MASPENSIGRGLAYVAGAQLADGSFASLSSPTARPFKPAHTYRTVFLPAVILNALSQIRDGLAVRQKLSAWLLAQKSPHWSFNYWAADAAERQRFPYPDDLDDTACALIGLTRHDPALIDAGAMGRVVHLLLAAETQVGGPYRTWLVSKQAAKAWQDVDLAVNCNIAYFLLLKAEELPNLTAYITKAIESGRFASPYYPSPYPLWYFAARTYRGPLKRKLAELILAQRQADGSWDTPLQTALAVSALYELGESAGLARAAVRLRAAQNPDGSWPAEAFCLDPAREGAQFFNGSPALTTALVLEALNHCARAERGAPVTQDKAADTIFSAVMREARREAQSLDGAVRAGAMTALARVGDGRHGREIVLLPYYVASALQKQPAKKLPQDLLVRLGLANLNGWVAYTLYDDLLDGDAGPPALPLANIAMRRSLAGFLEAAPADYQAYVRQAFTAIDEANAWELANCRLDVDRHGQLKLKTIPAYTTLKRLADRSLGHTLSPLAVVAAAGRSLQGSEARALLKGLRHYLIARQLHDDLHDWEADLRAGQCSYVVARLLAKSGLAPGTYQLDDLLPDLQRTFWKHTITDVGTTLRRQVRVARQQFKQSGLLRDENELAVLLGRIDDATAKAMAEQADAEAFLRAYRQNT
ncbi:MAG TPA: hypothetical protein VF466_04850 [Candidatus Saccharimonadales bacterium]